MIKSTAIIYKTVKMPTTNKGLGNNARSRFLSFCTLKTFLTKPIKFTFAIFAPINIKVPDSAFLTEKNANPLSTLAKNFYSFDLITCHTH